MMPAVQMPRYDPDDEPMVTRTGRVLADWEVQELADEAERGYDFDDDTEAYIEELHRRLKRIQADQDDRDNLIRARPVPPGYRTEIKEMDQGFYWHLYRGDRRINGGLAETRARAQHAAGLAIAAHVYTQY
jgi:hypothetical protein